MSNEKLERLLKKNGILGRLPEDLLLRVAERLTVETYKLGDTVLQMGQVGEAFYIIDSGKVRVVDDSGEGKPVTLAVLKNGDSFGEKSILYEHPVSATVRAAATTVLLKLAPEDFRELVSSHPEIRSTIESAAESQGEFNFLRTQNLLSGLSAKETTALIEKIETVHLKEDQILFEEGDEGDALYLIRSGSLKIIKQSEGDKLFGIKRTGDFLGEMSLLYDEPRSAAAIAAEDTTVMRLSRESFEEVVNDKEKIKALLDAQASRHLQQQQTILSSEDEEAQEELVDEPKVVVGSKSLGSGFFARSYPLAVSDEPHYAGVACLGMINQYFGQDPNLEALEEQQKRIPKPDDLYTLGKKMEATGLLSRLIKISPEKLEEVIFPAIARMLNGDLVVIYKVDKREVVIADPLRGLGTVLRTSFVDDWDGKLLTGTYIPDFGAVGMKVTNLWKQFLPLFRPYWPFIRRIVAITVLLEAIGLMPPFFTMLLIDHVLVVGDWNLLILMLIGILLATFVSSISGVVREFLMMHLMRRLTGTLFVRFFGHILALPIVALKKWDTGALMARFEENEKLLDMASNGGLSIIMNSISILIYTPILFSMDARLAALTMAFVVGMVITIIVCAPRLRAYEQRSFEAGSERDSHIIEVVKGITTVKTLAQERQFAEKGKDFFGREMKISFASERFDLKMELVTNLLEQGSSILILGIGAFFVLEGSLTAGQLIAFTAIAAAVMTPAEELANFYDEILELRIALDRLNDVLSVPREMISGAMPCPPLKGHIRFENLSFSYDPENGPKILKEINLEIQPGQKVAFVGRSGSGKSTLVNMVNRLLEPTEGTVFLDGIDISQLDHASLRQQIGVVEQKPYIFSGTIRENISKANPSLSLEANISAATLSGAHDFINGFPMRYDTRIGEGGRSLSGGQAQRLIIARSLAINPRLLILDEATAALDNESERIIQKNLDNIMEGRTTLVIAHRLSTIRNADQIVVLDQGQIAEVGSHDSLMEKQGIYYYLNNHSEA